jgi:hypothetical protein
MYMHVRKRRSLGQLALTPRGWQACRSARTAKSQPPPSTAHVLCMPSLALVTLDNGLGRSSWTPEAMLNYSRVGMGPRSTG